MILSLCANPAVDVLATIDRIEAGRSNRIREEYPFPGGKGVHVAMAVRELGEESVLLGLWGGPTGQWIRQACAALGVECDGAETEAWNRLCYTFKARGDFDDTELLGRGPEANEAQLVALHERFNQHLPRARAAVMSGSLPPGAPSSFYSELVKSCGEKQVPVFLDFTGEALTCALSRKPYGAHLNRHELATMGYAGEPAQAIQACLPELECLALTAGKDGLYLRQDGKVIHANIRLSEIKSAVGSGDCLVAGLAVAKVRGMSAMDTAAFAAACGAANCLREELGMLHRACVEDLLRQMTVKEIL